jgi:sensor histidine kinase YesM
LASILVAVYIWNRSIKQKQTILETESRLNRARINPHFFFNSLVALQHYAMQDKNVLQLVTGLSQFSRVMRRTLESTYKDEVVLREEIDFLNQYFAMQKIRFPESFKFTITYNPTLEIDSLLIPAMLIQPFVENSLEHGLINKEQHGAVTVHMEEQNDELMISIDDNGIGLDIEPSEENKHISRATQITQDRLYLLNLKHKSKARFLTETTNLKGVRVVLYLPIIYSYEDTLN